MGDTQQEPTTEPGKVLEFDDITVDELANKSADIVISRINPKLDDKIKAIAKNFGLEAKGEELTERIKQVCAELIKQSDNDTKRDRAMAMKEALFQGSPESRLKTHIKNVDLLFDGKGENVVGDGSSFAKMLLCMRLAKFNQDKAVELAEEAGDKTLASSIKSLSATGFQSGSALIPEAYSVDFIAALYAMNVVRALGARTVEMPSGNLTLGRQDATARAFWVGEGQAIQVSEPTFSQLKLTAKKLGVLVPISNDLTRRTTIPAGIGGLVRDDMLGAAGNAIDIASLRGSGTDATPKGVTQSMYEGHKLKSNPADPNAVTVDEIIKELFSLIFLIENSDINMQSPGWALSTRTKLHLMKLRDEGNWVFLDEMRNGTLLGFNFQSTTAIPTDLDVDNPGDNDHTEVIFGDWSQVIIGETLQNTVEEARDVSYVDVNGQTVHGIQTDESVVRLIHESDTALRRKRAMAMLQKVRWGKDFQVAA